MPSPTDRRYLDTHEWHLPSQNQEGDTIVTVGVSQFAVDELTDITFVDVADPNPGCPINAGQMFGEIESVKATSDLYCGVTGTLIEVNQAVVDDPSLINRDPFGEGWIARWKISDPSELDALLSAQDYDACHV